VKAIYQRLQHKSSLTARAPDATGGETGAAIGLRDAATIVAKLRTMGSSSAAADGRMLVTTAAAVAAAVVDDGKRWYNRRFWPEEAIHPRSIDLNLPA
jgi:hypothetical protein